MKRILKPLAFGFVAACIGYGGTMVPSKADETPGQQQKAEQQSIDNRAANDAHKVIDAKEAEESSAFGGTRQQRRAFAKQENTESKSADQEEKQDKKNLAQQEPRNSNND